MRISKKIVAIALSVLMAVSMMPFTVFAATVHDITSATNLRDTIANADAGDTIRFTEDINYGTTDLEIMIDKDLTVDLNGHAITGYAYADTVASGKDPDYTADMRVQCTVFAVRNGAKVEFKDSVGNGSFTYNNGGFPGSTNTTQPCFCHVRDTAEVTFTSGTYKYVGAAPGVQLSKGAHVLIADGNSKLTINDGKFSAEGGASNAAHRTLYVTGNSTVVINDGDFSVSKTYALYNAGTAATLTVNGGEFAGKESFVEKRTVINGGKFTETDGTTVVDVTKYLAPDAVQDASGKVVPVQATTVARIGNTEYSSVEDAFAAIEAASGTMTLTIVKDATTTRVLTLNNGQKLTIALGGNTLTADGTGKSQANVPHIKVYPGSTLKINGPGTFETANTPAKYDGALIKVYGASDDSGASSTTTITGDAVISSSGYGVSLFPAAGTNAAYNATITIGSSSTGPATIVSTATHDAAAVAVSGNIKTGDSVINLYRGTVTGNSTAGVGIYLGGNATLKATSSTDATVSGATGIYQKCGTATIGANANLTVIGNGSTADYKFYSNGFVATGDAYVIDNCGYPAGAPVTTIQSGTFTSTNGNAVASYAKQDDPLYPTADFPRVDEVIPGTSTAVFSSNVTALAAEDYKTVYDETAGGYVIAPVAYGTIGLYQAGEADITGNGTAHEKITISNSSLSYADPDYSVGRYYAGYYMGGIKFIAPEGTVISQDARYTNGSIDSTTGQLKVKNLFTAKDGANFMYSWPHVTEESLKAAIEAGENKTWEYTFDWDGDGYFEQEAIIELVCDTVKLVKSGEQVYPEGNNGYSVAVDSTTSMMTYIDVAAYVGNEANASVKVTYNNNADGESMNDAIDKCTNTVEFGYNDVEKQDGGTYDGNWIINIVQAPAQIADDITIEIYDGATKVKTITTSIANYCLQAAAELPDGNDKNLVEALYDYGKAVYETGGFAGGTYDGATFAHDYFNTAAPDFAAVPAVSKVMNQRGVDFISASFVATTTPSLRAYTNINADTAASFGYSRDNTENAYIGQNGMVYVDLGAVLPEDFDELKHAEIFGASIDVSVLNYAQSAYNHGATALGRSIYNYYLAAEAIW